MFIQTETTPNPLTMKFIPGVPVLSGGTAFYTDKSSAGSSPLALNLFEISGVKAVFLGGDFITITKAEDSTWEVMKPSILTTIMEYFVAGKVVTKDSSDNSVAGANDNELEKQIRELIDTRVRPAVAMDGGDIIYHSFENGIVKLELHGSCSGCPSSTMTLKNGIENMLKHYIPEVIAVEAVA